MKIRTRDFRVPQRANVRLRKWPTRVPAVYETNDDYEKMLTRHVGRLSALQELLYASDQWTLLVIFLPLIGVLTYMIVRPPENKTVMTRSAT